jgi:hypothetical protein
MCSVEPCLAKPYVSYVHTQVRGPTAELKAICLNITVKKMQVVNSVQIGLFKMWLRQLGYIPSLITIHFIIFLFLFFYQ